MILFVDKLYAKGMGGATTDIRKVEYILAADGASISSILKKVPKTTETPGGMFTLGKYIVYYILGRDLSFVSLALINHQINIEDNFDAWADELTPKSISMFHKLKQELEQRESSSFYPVELSDDELLFEETLLSLYQGDSRR